MELVSFELAKKLEEKGFKQCYNIFGYRLVFSDENTIKYISDIGAYEKEYFGINIPCPTISQVLKWLREEKSIHISVDVWEDGWYCEVWSYQNPEDGSKYFSTKFYNQSDDYDTYEQAVFAGIGYVLDNLI